MGRGGGGGGGGSKDMVSNLEILQISERQELDNIGVLVCKTLPVFQLCTG